MDMGWRYQILVFKDISLFVNNFPYISPKMLEFDLTVHFVCYHRNFWNTLIIWYNPESFMNKTTY